MYIGCSLQWVGFAKYVHELYIIRCTTDVSGQCIPGKQYSDCDDECGHSCEIYVKQEVILCADLCYSGCFCPPGLVYFRERCVDPLECWSLIESQCITVKNVLLE